MLLLNDGWKTARYYRTSTGKTEIINELEVRVDGKFRYKNSKQTITVNKISNSVIYPKIIVSINKKKIALNVHILISSTFLETPKDKDFIVDHIDRNKNNYNLNNLKFTTKSGNLLNRDSINQSRIYAIFDKEGSFKKEVSSCSLGDARKLMDSEDTIFTFSPDSFMRLKDKLVDEGIKYVDSLDWRLTNNSNHFISNIGLLKHIQGSNIKYSFGTIGSNGYYYVSNFIERHSSLVHVLVAEIFLNKGNKLPSNLVVDHINTDKTDNSYSNLRIVSCKENLNNPNTIKKLEVPIKCKNLGVFVYFKSINDCARILKISNTSHIYDWIKGIYKCQYKELSDFQYLTEEEMLNNNINYINSFEDLNLKQIPRNIKTREEMIEFVNENKLSSRNEYTKKGLENFYYKFVKKFSPIVYYNSED